MLLVVFIVVCFAHILQVFIAIVERISVDVMADIVERGSGNEPVH